MRIVIASDFHYGLKSAGFDRTPEIHRIVKKIIEWTVGEDRAHFICCGDTCHRANPNSEVHGKLFEMYEYLNGLGITSRFLIGNHDANKQRPVGCLAPLGEAGYEYVKAVPDICCEQMNTEWHFLYLPFPLEYELNEETFNKYIPDSGSVVVFSHLAVDGANLAGDFILRGARNSIPKFVLEHPQVKVVFNGHIHIPQTVGKVEIIGAPFQTDFGDTVEKSFLDVELHEDGTFEVTKVPTDHDKLVQITFDWSGINDDNPTTVLANKSWRDAIVKLDIKCREDQLPAVQMFADMVKKVAKFVRPFVPIVIREGKQAKTVIKAGMTDEEAVRSWVSQKSPMNTTQVLDFALTSLEE